MKLGIIGYGHVGKQMKNLLDHKYQTFVYDPAYEEYSSKLKNMDIVFICLPTPCGVNGRCDTSLVESAVLETEAELIVIKSTVEPGTTDRLKKQTNKNIIFNPEFSGESTYWNPYNWTSDLSVPFYIFGGDPVHTAKLVNVYVNICGPVKKYFQTTSIIAELTKYVSNTFAAIKIAFCYEIDQIAKKVGVDYNQLREAWLLDPRINSMHTAVFSDNKNPISGKCLPKDVAAFISWSISQGYDPELIKEVSKSNTRIGELRK